MRVSYFLTTYTLTRGRFDVSVSKLNQDQLNFRQNPNTLTAGEMALHVAGVEIWFASQLFETKLSEADQKIALCATEGAINDNPFPFSPEEITTEVVAAALAKGRTEAENLLKTDTPEILNKELKSALGPMINGEGAMARIAAHSFYHGGQIYMITCSPDFPA